jgi:hypothetical protein
MNVRNSGLIRHAQSVPKHGLQTVNGGRAAGYVHHTVLDCLFA